MKKKFGPYSLVNQGQLLKLKKLMFSYILKDIITLPNITVYGTTHNGYIKTLATQEDFRNTTCETRGEVSWFLDIDYQKVMSFYFYIDNYEQLERFRYAGAMYNGSTNIPNGTNATSSTNTCMPFKCLSIAPTGTSEPVASTIVLTFSNDADATSVNDVTIAEVGGSAIAYTAVATTTKVFTLTPDSDLSYVTEYEVVVPLTVKTTGGYYIEEIYRQRFTTMVMPMIFLQDIANLTNNLTSDLTLDQDLDFNDDSSYDQTDPDWQTKKIAWTTGYGWEPVSGGYSGTFDGNGHTISNLYMSFPTGDYWGLFTEIDHGTIKNLGVINASVTGRSWCGVIFGNTDNATILNCYASGSVNSTTGAGGLGGRVDFSSSISNCYSTTAVSSSSFAGGLLSYLSSSSTLTSCYYDSQTSGQSDTGKGEPKTTTQMKQEATFIGWDFTTIWDIVEGVSYPSLL